jgi:broad specificity phosphatase PhoE
VRPLGGSAEVPAYVAAHRAAFSSTHMNEEWRRRTLDIPGYRPDLDLSIVAPDSQIVAYASDLSRAWRTAEIALAVRALPVVRDPSWREAAYGVWEGLTLAEAAQRFPEFWQTRVSRMVAVPPPGGETLVAVQARVLSALDALRTRHAGQTVLVVTHAGPLAALTCWLHDFDLNDVRHHAVSNCGLSSLRRDESAHERSAPPSAEYWDRALPAASGTPPPISITP